ncbi:helix-turn-helix domain-containing protein [Herbiconiux solani]|uniref:helix-turn-helix domain-containing protein n=1 Tax=Herbiconiux solani TaxID=661329 RepID=UPI0035713948
MGRMRISSPQLDGWFTIAEAAREIGRSRDTIERWLRMGLPAQRVQGRRYIRATDLFSRYRAVLLAEPEVRTRWER